LPRLTNFRRTESRFLFARNPPPKPRFPAKSITSKPSVQIQNQGLESSSRATKGYVDGWNAIPGSGPVPELLPSASGQLTADDQTFYEAGYAAGRKAAAEK
jgi:hypothetical protein